LALHGRASGLKKGKGEFGIRKCGYMTQMLANSAKVRGGEKYSAPGREATNEDLYRRRLSNIFKPWKRSGRGRGLTQGHWCSEIPWVKKEPLQSAPPSLDVQKKSVSKGGREKGDDPLRREKYWS